MWNNFNSPVPVQPGYTIAYIPPAPAGRGCGCGGPRGMMGGQGGMLQPVPGGGGPGTFPPGPGPGPFPPGPGPFPPGPGPFPPGPFPPGPGPIPPFPIPFPPFPVPLPNFVTVVINGGRFFPWVTQAYRVRHFPGMSVYQALAATGVVQFNRNGQIAFVNGVAVAGDVGTIVSLNGRRIPPSLFYLPVQAGDSVGLDLILTGSGTVIPRTLPDTPYALPYNLEIVNNYDHITDDPQDQ
ncbi:hypothetical protein [Paenibacillus nasutitermitis]|uniref:hypothetical protein n=1 Tax=Paenibacillus nasutitermitis TaxID=1652958 RepID=UPI001666C95D|nr:hypothetical protein [Paenibacillus nasutitermitis]